MVVLGDVGLGISLGAVFFFGSRTWDFYAGRAFHLTPLLMAVRFQVFLFLSV